MQWSLAVISDARSTSLLPKNWLPRKRSAAECIFRTVMVRLFHQNALLLSDNASQGIYSPIERFYPNGYFNILIVLIYLYCKCTYLTWFKSFFLGPAASVLPLYCNLTISSPSGDCLQSPHFSGLYIPYRDCSAAGKDPSSVDSTGTLVLLTLYDTSISHIAASIVACCSITMRACIREYIDMWPTVWMQLNTHMGIHLFFFSY